MTVSHLLILSVFALLISCGPETQQQGQAPLSAKDSTHSLFDVEQTNPEFVEDLEFESLRIPVPSEKLLEPYHWDTLSAEADLFLQKLKNPSQVFYRSLQQPQIQVCGKNFDPTLLSNRSTEVGDLAILRIYFCTESWVQRPNGYYLELKSLRWNCDPQIDSTPEETVCTASLDPDDAAPSVFLPASLSTLLQILGTLEISESQTRFLLHHLQSAIVPFTSDEILMSESFKNPSYVDLPQYIEKADRIEAFSFEDELLTSSPSGVLASYWSSQKNRSYDYFKNLATTDVLAELVLRNNTAALLKVARTETLNSSTQSQGDGPLYSFPVVGGVLPRTGLTPLMIAGLSGKSDVAHALLKVAGIEPGVIADTYQASYEDFLNWGSEDFLKYPAYQSDSRAPKKSAARERVEGAPPHDPNLPIIIEKDCQNCTLAMHMIHENQCQSIEAIARSKDFDINYQSLNKVSALKVGLALDQCLADLVLVENIDLKSNLVYQRWIKEEKTHLLQSLPKSFWQNLPKAEKDAVVKMVLNQKNITLKNFENTFYFSRAELIETIGRTGLSDIHLSSRGLSLLIFDYEVNPFHLKDIDGSTLLDHFLAERNYPFLEKLRNKNPEWLRPWVQGQTFFGHNPLVTATIFSEIKALKFLLAIPGAHFGIVDEATGLNGREWNELVEHRAVNVLNKSDDLEDSFQNLQFRFDVWSNLFFSGETPKDFINTHKDPDSESQSTNTRPSPRYTQELYRSFFRERPEGECNAKLEVPDSYKWLNCYPFESYSKESRVILSKGNNSLLSFIGSAVAKKLGEPKTLSEPKRKCRYTSPGPRSMVCE